MSRLRARRKPPFRRPSLPNLRSEGGFALVEVMVSAVLLVVLTLATYPILDQSAGRTSSNRARAVAASYAEQDQDRMRSMPQATLKNVDETTTKKANGVTFTIKSKAQLTNDVSGAVTCSGSTGAAQYVTIRTEVSWANMNGIDPVVLNSTVAPNVTGVNKGTLIVTVLRADGVTGVSGIPVGAGGQTVVTDAAGCALFPQLSPGQTFVTADKPGYVGTDGKQAQSLPVSVVNSTSSVRSFLYDTPAGIGTSFKLLDGTSVKWYDASFSSGTYPVQKRPTSATTRVPSLDATTQANGLFPFAVGYQVYAGDCSGNDPTIYKSNFFATNPGGTAKPLAGTFNATTTAYMNRVLVSVKKANNTKLSTKRPNIKAKPNTTYTMGTPAVAPMTGCTDSVNLSSATSPGPATVAGGSVPDPNPDSTNCQTVPNQSSCSYVDLPWGIYDICADDANGTSSRRKVITVNSTPAGSTPAPTTGVQLIDLDLGTPGSGLPGTGTYATGLCP